MTALSVVNQRSPGKLSDLNSNFVFLKTETVVPVSGTTTMTTVANGRPVTVSKGQKRPRIEPLPTASVTTTTATTTVVASSSSSSPELMRCKRRINFAQIGYALPQAPPAAMARRNERERNRVKLVNLGFATLREHVPSSTKNKMSKVDTLRSAVEYIKRLQDLLDENESGHHHHHHHSLHHHHHHLDSATASELQALTENLMPGGIDGSGGGGGGGGVGSDGTTTSSSTCPPSSVSPTCSVASSPTPSYASDCSSYEPLSPEEEDLLDFTTWFS